MDVRVFDLMEEYYPKNDPNVAGRTFAQSSVKFVQIKAVLEYLNLINEQSS